MTIVNKEEIIEKIKKNPKYIHPCNKEFQEDIKIYGFENGNRFICWMQQNGILRDTTMVQREQHNMTAINAGYQNYAEYVKNIEYYSGRLSISECEDSDWPIYFGINIGEKLFKNFLGKIFGCIKTTKFHDKGIDFICKYPKYEFMNKYSEFDFDINKEYKIQLKIRCLRDGYRWQFDICFNDKVDYFLLAGFDTTIDLNLIHIWLIHKDKRIRKGNKKGFTIDKMYNRGTISIVNNIESQMSYKYFKNYDLIDIY